MNRTNLVALDAHIPKFQVPVQTNPALQQKVAILPIKRSSRDEMNLAEFPLTVLSTRTNANLKTLEFKDTVKGKNGELVERSWVITGADKFGLPTASDDEVLLGLLKLTVDGGFQGRKVYFTRYELLRILRWTTEGRSYTRLQRALDRLSGVRIKAANAFYDNESKSHSTRNFGIIDAYEINDGRNTEPKPSFFEWSEAIFKSFKAGFIKKLDLDLYLDLQSAVSKRLYRFLDKHFWYKSKVEMPLFTLCHEKIGISRNYQFASALRQQLDPALEELIKVGFLDSFHFAGKGRDTSVCMFSHAGTPRSQIKSSKSKPTSSEFAVQRMSPVSAKESEIMQALGERGIGVPQARKLLSGRSLPEFERMLKIIEHFDRLCSNQSHLVSRNPVGFLYRAVEDPKNFRLPGEEAQTSLTLPTTPRSTVNSEHKRRANTLKRRTEEEPAYLIERRQEAIRLRDLVEPELFQSISKEVEQALTKVKASIKPERFSEVVQHGIDEKLLELFDFPNFDEWKSRKR